MATKHDRVTRLHRINLDAEVKQIVPANPNRISLTVSVFHSDTANNHPAYIGADPNVTRETGFPIRPSDTDMYVETVDALYAARGNDRNYAIRVIEVEYV